MSLLGHYLGRSLRLKPREWDMVVHCPRCNYWLKIKVQSRHGGHGCTQCGGNMEVYLPRPDRFDKPAPIAPFNHPPERP